MNVRPRTHRILVLDELDKTHELFSSCLTSIDRSGFTLSHARRVHDALELVGAAREVGEPFAVAFVDGNLNSACDTSALAGQLWRADPHLQLVLYAERNSSRTLELGFESTKCEQLLLVRKPLDDEVIQQWAETLSERWAANSEMREHLWRLQREIDQRLEAEANLRRMAEHDALTKLPNRSVLLERLAGILRNYCPDSPCRDAVLFLDLDNFKTINDTLGHHAGDDLLNQVAERLRSSVRNHDTTVRNNCETVRLGGDEFVVLMERLPRAEDAIRAARRIVEQIAEPFRLDDRMVNVGSSIGIAFVDGTVNSPEQLLKNADTAMYRAKLNGKGRVAVFDRGMHDDVSARLELESALRAALDNNEFSVLYQPIIHLATGQMCAVEALLRWTLRDGTTVPPSDFIPLAEEIGLITQIGYWTIEHATRELKSLITQFVNNDSELELNVNVSHFQLWDNQFENRLDSILNKTGFPKRLLKLEINESIAMRKPRETAAKLYSLNKLGYGISMDDFGTGQSSLACFYQFPIEMVKIDRTFVGSIAHNHSHRAIVKAVIDLAHSLNTTVVAEGLESIEQVRSLQGLGCDRGQGYHFAAPLTAKQLIELICSRYPLLPSRRAKSSTLPADQENRGEFSLAPTPDARFPQISTPVIPENQALGGSA
jgi:diguanylate cyclase (GGDEF)-like protein